MLREEEGKQADLEGLELAGLQGFLKGIHLTPQCHIVVLAFPSLQRLRGQRICKLFNLLQQPVKKLKKQSGNVEKVSNCS